MRYASSMTSKSKLKLATVNILAELILLVARRTFFNPIRYLEHSELKNSAEFIKLNLQDVALFDSKKGSYFNFVMDQVAKLDVKGLWLEFGVREGVSTKIFAKHSMNLASDGVIHGFDSFEGIRDSWSSIGEPAGSFSLSGQAPRKIPGCSFVVGWVEDTLEQFLESHDDKIAFVHFDFDVFPPTKFALEKIYSQLVPGSIILFDEFHGYPGWEYHEKKALEEVIPRHKYKFIAFSRKQAAFQFL